MQTRLSYYVKTAVGGHIKLGTIVTTKDCRVPGVVDEVGRLLGVDGWNCYEINGKIVIDGPGIPSESVLEFIVVHSGQAMSLRYDDKVDISKFVVPKIGGYKYVAPVVEDEVVEVGVASSESIGVVVESELMKKKKSELLEILGDDGDGKLSKAELVELIVNKLNK